ncbi:MAG: 4-alpha-glucanotransferase [Verrucomicrobia bacterium]|nr:4-alpha-glucanotransferase [Verrucomicrobiota bacterium]
MKIDYESGILMHVTSLPCRYGVGEFGQPVLDWLDQMVEMGQRIWQVLPMGPTGYGDSPYQSPSCFAGNPMLIGIGRLVEAKWLGDVEVASLLGLPSDTVSYEHLIPIKSALLQTAAQRFLRYGKDTPAYQRFERFCQQEAAWLEDYAVFAAVKERETLRPWFEWPDTWRNYSADCVARARTLLPDVIEEKKVIQFFFREQWVEMRKEAARRGILILGDIPIFVAHDSVEVWSDRLLFQLNAKGDPTVVAGVPPDYFSATGQRWGNPLYDWPMHERQGFAWWERRLARALDLYDWVRVDHFRGFVDYWEIPASEPSAVRGQWRPSPGRALFEAMRRRFGDRLNIVAEDLGVLSQDVIALREAFGFPGMRILQFAFGTDPGAYTFLPEAYVRNTVAYTGTHDNDTVVSWFHDKGGQSMRTPEQCEKERQYCLSHLGIPGREIHWEMIEVLLRSKAGALIFPVQDILGLGSEGRMNVPGTTAANWRWRLRPGQLTPELKARLRQATLAAGRNQTSGAKPSG